MKTTNFFSKQYPEMNHFLSYLEKALENLPDNPKPACQGFYLAYYNPKKNKLVAEKIGTVPVEKEFKYLNFACKKATQTLLLNAVRSKDFENNDLEQYPGAFVIKTPAGPFCAGVSGHESMIDEAISALWLIAKKIESESVSTHVTGSTRMFYSQLRIEAERAQRESASDNKWISVIAGLMEKSF